MSCAAKLRFGDQGYCYYIKGVLLPLAVWHTTPTTSTILFPVTMKALFVSGTLALAREPACIRYRLLAPSPHYGRFLWQEHSRRVWSVAYSPQEPSLFASGSDDCTVKLWSHGQPNSIFSFSARANICSVKFNPHSRYLLAYGSADHGVHYLDLRSPNKPLLELLGHKKAVSYVNFMGPKELVSA